MTNDINTSWNEATLPICLSYFDLLDDFYDEYFGLFKKIQEGHKQHVSSFSSFSTIRTQPSYSKSFCKMILSKS